MYDVAPGHAPALVAALLLLVFLWAFLKVSRILGRRGLSLPGATVTAWDHASPLVKVAATLMMTSGAIHLELVGHHGAVTGVLFVVDGFGFIALAIGAFVVSWWRRPAILWLLANLVAYVVWIVAGWEAPDQVGIACKLIELIALGLVLRLGRATRHSWPRRAWRAIAYPLTASLTTIGILLGGLAHPDALHAHAGAVLQPVAYLVTPNQRAAAAQLLAQTKVDIDRYQDPAAAIAAGYKPGPGSAIDPLVHFENKANAHAVLDPAHPQALVYIRTPHGLQLAGAMFQMPRAGQWGPDPGGALTQWHQHEGICFSPFGIEFSFATPFWTCPVGSTNITTPPMLHVWIIDNGKNGPFAADLDKSAQRRLQQEASR